MQEPEIIVIDDKTVAVDSLSKWQEKVTGEAISNYRKLGVIERPRPKYYKPGDRSSAGDTVTGRNGAEYLITETGSLKRTNKKLSKKALKKLRKKS